MASNYTSDLFKGLHDEELDRMAKLDAGVGLPTAVITVMFGVSSYYLHNFPEFAVDRWVIVFQVLSLAFVICLLYATYYVFRSALGSVTVPASPDTLADYMSELEKYYAAENDNREEVDRLVEGDLREVLRQQHIECSSENCASNGLQMNRQYKAKLGIAAALGLLIVSALPFYVIQRMKPNTQNVKITCFPEVQKVELVQPKTK